MKTARMILAMFVITACAYHAWAQGSLTPPGAPAASMKTLSQVEPRTPISSLPYTISQSGSYYLTTNLSSTNHGVIIATSGVTLDLMGFTISGDRDDSDHGIFLDGGIKSPIYNIVVQNGIVQNFGAGIYTAYAHDSRFEHLIGASNLQYGIVFFGCDHNTIADCTFSDNGYSGIYLDGSSSDCNDNTIAHSTIRGSSTGIYLNGYDGLCNGNTLVNCTVSESSTFGIHLEGGEGQCDGNTIANCTLRYNVFAGITIRSANGNRVEGNHVSGQTNPAAYGIHSEGTKNLIFCNTCIGVANQFSMSANDTYGPIVTNSGALPTTGAGSHPLANFAR